MDETLPNLQDTTDEMQSIRRVMKANTYIATQLMSQASLSSGTVQTGPER